MASASGKNASKNRTNKNRSTSRTTKRTTSNTRGRRSSSKSSRKNVDIAVKNEVMLIMIFAAAIFMFLCVTGIIRGAAAEGVRNVMFGLFGLLAYIVPIIIFLGFAFGISNKGNTVAIIKMVSAVILVFLVGIIAYMVMKQESLLIGISLVKELYETSVEHHAGGGVLFGSVAHGLNKLVGFGGSLFVVGVLGIISVVFITERSFLSGVKKGSSYLIESAREDAARMREYRESLREEYEQEYDDYEEVENTKSSKTASKRKKRVQEPHKKEAEERARRIDKKARGVASSTAMTLKAEKAKDAARQDIHEIVLLDEEGAVCEDISVRPYNTMTEQEPSDIDMQFADQGIAVEKSVLDDVEDIEEPVNFFGDSYEEVFEEPQIEEPYTDSDYQDMTYDIEAIDQMPEPVTEHTVMPRSSTENIQEDVTIVAQEETFRQERPSSQVSFPEKNPATQEHAIQQETSIKPEEVVQKKYIFPPLHLLKKGEPKKGDSTNQLKETALRLQQTLANFGVKVTITDISQGPSVTRYEMQPEQGVKVSKIVGLADDIKLNLAATDIRIEAPIPGKAAVGIEVPNKENSMVAFRDLLESQEFQNFSSNLAFAVGKDIAGQTVVTDIAKMPHVLIAGATGSGKSVCINTIVMSILYKADPSDVKLIMIDPKVVELSVYNGIPHLMIPVVTDPKKASAALNWGVAEMDDRYKKFAELNVRDLKGYNKAAEMGKTSADGEPIQKLPQIVIIVDELADLMMVASGEVEASICRLAQLARACGIHLVIATQRPSVDVITGLIKANMPSRIAFSVSSGVDSRTILDMNGAEKLLGKGDMLFYPQGYTKPARVQGAFVSDSEVSDVVDFLKNQMLGNTYSSDIEDKIKTLQSPSGGGAGGGSDVDTYFAEAAKFVIEKDKASIGMLQRVFKIGFNRAARIVDQLEEAGVVGAEEGTKPRRILMSMEQFQTYMDENM